MSKSPSTSRKSASRQPTRDKRAKFVELANNRVNRTLKDLALVGNLANRRNYEYDDEQAKKILKALQAGIDQLRTRFSSRGPDNNNQFEL